MGSNKDFFQEIKYMSPEEATKFITLLFDGYAKRKKENRLYAKDGDVAKIIISAYYNFVDRRNFDDIFGDFKKKYIRNESIIENAHTKPEREGLGAAYDYIQAVDEVYSDDIEQHNVFSKVDIYTILRLNHMLFQYTDHPEVGGNIRTGQARLKDAPIELTSADMIIPELQSHYLESKELVKRGLALRENPNSKDILDYIEDVIKLKVALIKIHPFADGNGRTVRVFTNLLFKAANIPPVYVQASERDEYLEAMDKALVEPEYNPEYNTITTFYLYKICDSIIELDLSYNKEKSLK